MPKERLLPKERNAAHGFCVVQDKISLHKKGCVCDCGEAPFLVGLLGVWRIRCIKKGTLSGTVF